MISQYIYISTAPRLSREDVDSILDASAHNNPAKSVTGLLLYNGRNFMQLLEGERAELDALMVRICDDSRHTGVTVIHDADVETRACPEWAMKRVIIAESIANRREMLADGLPEGLSGDARKMILNFAILN